MRLILHIGLSKTGTTSLQRSFFDRRGTLADAGILYPAPLEGIIAHHALSAVAMPEGPVPNFVMRRNGSIEAAERVARAMLAGVAATDPAKFDTVILSSEALANPRVSPEGRARLTESLKTIGVDVEVVAYVREPASRFLSGLQEHQKSSGQVTMKPIREFREIFEDYEALFGTRITPVAFERSRLHLGDSAADFLHRFLPGRVPETQFAGAARNMSISGEGMIFMRNLHEEIVGAVGVLPDGFSTTALKALRRFEESDPQQPVLRDDVALRIRRAATEYLWLRDRYGISFDVIDYDEISDDDDLADLTTARLEEILYIDRERLHRLSEVTVTRLAG